MSARIERNWMGVFELRYKCPKCNCTLTSFKKEIEEGKDTCPECGNVITFPSSLPGKFDAAEKEHEENVADKKEAKRILREEKKREQQREAVVQRQKNMEKLKEEEEYYSSGAFECDWDRRQKRNQGYAFAVGMCLLSLAVLYPAFWVVNMAFHEAFDTNYAKQYRADRVASANKYTDWQAQSRAEQAERDAPHIAKAEKGLKKLYPDARGTGAFGRLKHTKVDGGVITEIKGENAFGGTVRNQILTTDDGVVINLSAP